MLSYTSDLTRFNVYAPWVQRLELFNDSIKYEFWCCRNFLDTLTDRPLLPNLRILSLSTDHGVLQYDYNTAVELFVCPSLVVILHTTDYCPQHYITAQSARCLVQKVSALCPGLQRLEFYPGRCEFTHLHYSNLFSSPDAAFPKILSGFSNLRSFSSTAFILEPVFFQALGGLLALETLCIVDYDPEEQIPPSLDKDFRALDTSFPALRNLQLYDIHCRDITTMWSQPPLVQKLYAVTIRCYPGAPDDEETETLDGQEWIDTFLPSLARASPYIEQLDIEFKNLPCYPQRFWMPDGREDLRRLPLRSVRLRFSEHLLDLGTSLASSTSLGE